MKLFTAGPVMMYPETLAIQGSQQPYFRTPEFSEKMKDIEDGFLSTIYAGKNAHFVALTCSGTGAMEAAVVNTLTPKDKVLVINGGSFGRRFADICHRFSIPADSYNIPFCTAFSKDAFESYDGSGYTALLVNACDTSTCQKYDLDYLGEFCRRNNMLFIVDAVSAYLADPIYMDAHGIDVVFTASQKALALAPGVSLIAVSDRVYQERIKKNEQVYYFDFNNYIENQKRGQPPFTCAVGTMLALHQRMQDIVRRGVEAENALHAQRAAHFRALLKELPLMVPDIPMSNCCTAVLFPDNNADIVYREFKEKYDIILTPSGGSIKEKQLRVGHMGALQLSDYDDLVEKLKGVIYE